MKLLLHSFFIFYTSCLCLATQAIASETYLHRFTSYMTWAQELPITPNPDFLEFIDEKKPLSQKLREKWLYDLAQRNDWHSYIMYYKPSNDLSLQCYAQFALYQEGKKQEAIQASKKLWLTGNSQPPACDKLFILLFKENVFDEQLIYQRTKLALENQNYLLAAHLLKKLNYPSNLASTLEAIYLHPKKIAQLKAGDLNADLYLYGIKRLLKRNLDQANELLREAKSKGLLNEHQQQELITHIALYKSIRNRSDAPNWLAKIKQEFINEPLIEWKIRFALKNDQWPKVESLIKQSSNQDTPCWQYWLARSLDAQGRHTDAIAIYQKLALYRNYYGFLANIRLKQPFEFQDEKTNTDTQILTIYKPIIQQIKTLYASKQTTAASRLANDFTSELPKDEKSAFVYWLSSELHWFDKTIYLSNDQALSNQLTLRFPLAYRDNIKQQSKHYQVPEALIYAIIRQESAFKDDAISCAGAHGLMQLMPSTAAWISKTHHITYDNKQQLFSFTKNIHLGVAYLNHLIKNYNNQLLLVVAAYNAGPTQVRAWLHAQPLKEADIWIETIPYFETRNYLKSVVAYYLVYQHQLQEKPNLDAFIKH